MLASYRRNQQVQRGEHRDYHSMFDFRAYHVGGQDGGRLPATGILGKRCFVTSLQPVRASKTNIRVDILLRAISENRHVVSVFVTCRIPRARVSFERDKKKTQTTRPPECTIVGKDPAVGTWGTRANPVGVGHGQLETGRTSHRMRQVY